MQNVDEVRRLSAYLSWRVIGERRESVGCGVKWATVSGELGVQNVFVVPGKKLRGVVGSWMAGRAPWCLSPLGLPPAYLCTCTLQSLLVCVFVAPR